MTDLNLTNFDAVLKQHYTDARVRNMVYQREPFLAVLPKMESYGGRNLPIPIQYEVTMGRAATFSTARDNKRPSKFEDFLITTVKDYSLASIQNKALKEAQGNINTFLNAATSEVNSAIRSATRSLAWSLPRSGTGSIGQIGSITEDENLDGTSNAGTTVITLKNTADITSFGVGQRLGVSDTDGGALRDDASDNIAEVDAVDRSDGRIHVTTNVVDDFTDSWAADDYLHVEGDAADGGTNLKVSGLAAWLPSSTPSSGESFFGVDRSVDSRLYGTYQDNSGKSIREGLIDLSVEVAREGGMPDVVVMNHEPYGRLLKELEGERTFASLKAAGADISFKTLTLNTPGGDVKILPDHNFPTTDAYMLQLDTWKLYSTGPAPQIFTYTDGHRMVRESDDDAVELRVGYYAQVGCNGPGFNGRMKLPS